MLASPNSNSSVKLLKKVLVIQTAFMGDCVLATALLESLHAANPDLELHFLINEQHKALFIGHPYLKKLWTWDKKNKYKNLYRLIKSIRAERFGAVINAQRFAATGLITLFSGAAIKVGFDKNPLSGYFDLVVPHTFENGLHEVARNHQLLETAISDCAPAKPRLYPTEAVRKELEQFTMGAYITISPMSVWPTKTYPIAKWVDLLKVIPAKYKVYLLGGPADFEGCTHLVEEAKQAGVSLTIEIMAGKLSFQGSAVLMESAAMNYMNDSGPVHLASAVNAPQVLVYCSTTPFLGFGPLSDNGVFVETEEVLPCRPCGITGKKECPLQHFNCAIGIKTSQFPIPQA
jgi:heptosyltransferase-2